MNNTQDNFGTYLALVIALVLAATVGMIIVWHTAQELFFWLFAGVMAIAIMAMLIAALTLIVISFRWADKSYYPLKKELTPDVKMLIRPGEMDNVQPIAFIDGEFEVSD